MEQKLEQRVKELYKRGTFGMFVADFRKVMTFYHNAETSVDRSINGEEEHRKAKQYANVLLNQNYLRGKKEMSGLNDMEKLAIISELEPLVELLTHAA